MNVSLIILYHQVLPMHNCWLAVFDLGQALSVE